MPIYTFSAKESSEEDQKIVRDVKQHCKKRYQNFSGLIIKLLKDYADEHIYHNERSGISDNSEA